MHWLPDVEYGLVKQRQRELIEQAERDRLAAGVRRQAVRGWLRASWANLRGISLRLTLGDPYDGARQSGAQRSWKWPSTSSIQPPTNAGSVESVKGE